MWKTKFLKWTYGMATHLSSANINVLSSLRRFGKQLLFRLFAPRGYMMTKIDGMPFYIYCTPASIQEYILQPFEPYTTELFKRAVKPGAVVLDIGAQFRYYSLLAARSAGPNGQVFAFESVLSNFEVLKKNIEKNNFTCILPIQKAVGDDFKTVTIFIYKYSNSHGMFRHPQAAIKEAIPVECITIDEFLGGRTVDIIKMDIEGNEPYALEGMKETISKSNNMILI